MSGEKNLKKLLASAKPKRHSGEYVFCAIEDLSVVNLNEICLFFREEESCTIIVKKEYADHLELAYSFVASWITLTIHSSLDGVGFTAAFSSALAAEGIGCNVVAAFYHDHIFVDQKDADRAMGILANLK